MCGIAGIFNFNGGSAYQLPRVLHMTKAMKRRGPDDEGFMAVTVHGRVQHFVGDDSPVAVRERFSGSRLVTSSKDVKSVLAMGHRRLSILDTSAAGHQPMCDPTGRFWIVFNGEIYNFKEIRRDLETRGYRFKTSSDTEVILASYAEWGEDCVRRFNGDFAFALWDGVKGELFCARDRIGIKPFYYAYGEGRFVFASDIKAVLASGYIHPEPDPHGLYLAMAFGMAPRPMTAFKGIRALEQGCWMRVQRDGHVEKRCYWKIPVGTQDLTMTEEDATGLLEEQLQLAVRRRLVADVPVGTFMSGGVDSTMVSAIAARNHPGIKAFTLGFQSDAPELDEVPQAVATARMHPMQHIVHRVNPEDSLKDVHEWIDGYEEPFYHLAANYVISKLVREHDVIVVLNGLGGDELFAGYSWYRYHWFRPIALLGAVARTIQPVAWGRVDRGLQLFRAKHWTDLHTVMYQKTPDRDLRELLAPSLHLDASVMDYVRDLYATGVDFEDAVEAISYMDLKNYIGNHHVHRVDQFTMSSSVEGRFPFLDHEVVEAAFRIPSHLKIRRGVQKLVLRRLASRYIAPECLKMKKKGFGLPLKQWLSGPLKELVDDSLERLKRRPEINGDAVSCVVDKFTRDVVPASRLWHLVALELWFQRFIDEKGR